MREILFLCCSFLFINCTAPKKYIDLTSHPLKAKNIRLDIKSLESWQHKDIIEDTIPGISLDKAYRELLKKRKRQSVIVAVIDEEIDIHNVDFKKSIWTNVKEIEGNGIDDDGNGYVDDIHGWNFIGNQKGENIIYANMESIRIVRKLKPKIENNTTAHVSDTEKILYQKALLEYENLKKNRKSDKEYIEAVADAFIKGKEIIKDFFPNNEYDVKKIDSILLAYPNDTERNYYVSYFKQCLENKVTEKWIANYKKNVEEMTNKCINIDYNDRLIPGDNPYDIKDSNYGNNNVSANVDVLEHGTTVVGILSSERNNGVGINGISNYLKIMPLSIASYGNENDKDIALAIRYAVDNGAKVINMSFGKLLSMNENWVLDAIRYAADNDVLIISSAGNGGNEVNSEKPYYPNDGNYFDNEVSDNFRHCPKKCVSLKITGFDFLIKVEPFFQI